VHTRKKHLTFFEFALILARGAIALALRFGTSALKARFKFFLGKTPKKS